MRRKSTRNSAKSPEKPKQADQVRKSRRTSKRRRKSTTSESEKSDMEHVPQTPAQLENSSEEQSKNVTLTENDGKKPEVGDNDNNKHDREMSPDPRTRSKKRELSIRNEDIEERTSRRSKRRGSPKYEENMEGEENEEEEEGRVSKGKSKGKNKSKVDKREPHNESETFTESEISTNAQVTPQSPQTNIDKPVTCENVVVVTESSVDNSNDKQEENDPDSSSGKDLNQEKTAEVLPAKTNNSNYDKDECKELPEVIPDIKNVEKISLVQEPICNDNETSISDAIQTEKMDASETEERESPGKEVNVNVSEEESALEIQKSAEIPEDQHSSNDIEKNKMKIECQEEHTKEPSVAESEVPVGKAELFIKEYKTKDESSKVEIKSEENQELQCEKEENAMGQESVEGEQKEMSKNKIHRSHKEDAKKKVKVAKEENSQNKHKIIASEKPKIITQKIKIKRTVSESGETDRDSKRKWGMGLKLFTNSVSEVDTNVLLTIYPNVKLLEETEVKLEHAEPKIRKLSTADSIDSKFDRRMSLEDHSFDRQISDELMKTEEQENDNANIIAFNRKISIIDDSATTLKPPPSPAHNPVSDVLFITNLVRPFTLKQLRELLERTGKIKNGGFWTDRIKSKCYVQYEGESEAQATREALHGIHWPIGNGKKLIIDYSTFEELEHSRNPPAVQVVEPSKSDKENEEQQKKKTEEKKREKEEKETHRREHVREWDMGKQDLHRTKSKTRDSTEKRRHSKRSPSPPDDYISKKKKKVEEPVPQKLMDDLFQKTKATPSIYWQPLTPEEIATKQQQRLERMAEHKKRLEETSRGRAEYARGGPYRRKYD